MAKVSDNAWGDKQAPISVAPPKVGPCFCAKPAAGGPPERAPTPAAPLRQRYQMAGGKAK